MLATLRRSKTDQEGLGRRVAIPRGEIACPVAALRAWLDAAGITEGAIFRRIFNKRAQRITDRRLAPRNSRQSSSRALPVSASIRLRLAAILCAPAS
jgi:hypothetical protein